MAFMDPGELAELERIAARRRAYETYKAMATPQIAQGISSLAGTYPNMRPGTALALGKANVPASSPVATAAAKAEAKQGWGWNSIGDIVTGGASILKDVVGAVAGRVPSTGGEVMGVVKGISRGVDMGLNSGGQAIQGGFRNALSGGALDVASALNPATLIASGAEQTDLAAGHREIQREGGYAGLLTGRTDVNYGSGFFVGGDVRAEAVQRRRAAAPLINGKAASLGRYTASQVVEPGTRSFAVLSGLIDGSVLLAGDPSTYVGGASRRALEARRVLPAGGPMREVTELPGAAAERAQTVATIRASQAEGLLDETDVQNALRAAGGIDGSPRKTVLPEKVAEWLDSKQGRRLRKYLASETDFQRLRENTKGKIDVETLVKIVDAKDDASVLAVLGPKLCVDIRERFGVSKGALDAARGSDVSRFQVGGNKARLASQMPGTHMDLVNPDVAVQTVERFLANVNMRKVEGLGAERVGYWTERMARQTDRNGRFAVTRDMLAEVRDGILKEQGSNLTKGQRDRLTRMYDNYDEELRRYAIDEIGENAHIPGALVDGAGKALPTPHLFNEYVNTAVPLPDARELRRATSDYVRLVDKAGLRGAYDGINLVADFTTQQLFKPLVLLRGAWTIRVVGEEQIRLASSGMTSAFAHPFSHIALAMGRKGGKDITGEDISMAEEFQEAMSRGSMGFRKDPKVVRTRHRVVLDRMAHREKFGEALLDEIGKLNADPVMRRVLNGLGSGDLHPNPDLTGIDAVKDWFFNGTGRKFRDEMANADRGGDRAFLGVKVAPDGSINSADGYIDSLLERAKTIAGGDQRLLDAMATGQINGKPLSYASNGHRLVNRDALRDLKALLDEGAGPQKVPGDLMVHGDGTGGHLAQIAAKYDAATEQMFNVLMSKPTNFLSRSPAFQQFYWRRNAEIISRMTPEAQDQAIRVARESGLSDKTIKMLERGKRQGSGELNVAEADLVSKAFALDSTRRLLYDLSDRSQFFDITRAIFPFGEAWKEVGTTWARIGFTENPVVLRRAQQVVTGLRAADTDGDGAGFFYTDPQTGEETFNYPFSGWINEQAAGVPAPLRASASGLNIFSTSVLPGVGPVVQMTVGKHIPNRPEWESVRKVVNPFGERDTTGGVLESFFPAWFKKAMTAFDADSPSQERMWLNTVMDVSRYLVSTGEYSLNSPEEQQRTLEAAERRARRLYGIRALAQFFVPSPPSPQFVTEDKDGRALLSIKMVEEYYKMQEQDYSTATERFVEKFGEDAFLATVAKTEGGGRPSPTMWRFIQENPQVAKTHPKVFGYFLKPDEKFSQEAYNYQLAEGIRTPIKPKEALEIANQRLGAMVYRQAQSKVTQDARTGKPKPSKAERVWLAQVRDAVAEEYPGYSSTPGNLRDQKLLIENLIRAGRSPALAATDAGKGLALYVQEREVALRIARERGLTTFTSAKAAADLRAALRIAAERIAEQHPDFTDMFDRTFNREMVNDEPEVDAA